MYSSATAPNDASENSCLAGFRLTVLQKDAEISFPLLDLPIRKHTTHHATSAITSAVNSTIRSVSTFYLSFPTRRLTRRLPRPIPSHSDAARTVAGPTDEVSSLTVAVCFRGGHVSRRSTRSCTFHCGNAIVIALVSKQNPNTSRSVTHLVIQAPNPHVIPLFPNTSTSTPVGIFNNPRRCHYSSNHWTSTEISSSTKQYELYSALRSFKLR